MMSYQFQAGLAAAAPTFLSSPIVTKNSKNLPTLMLFLHPHCPCSRATVNELARLVARTNELSEIHVLFYQPSDQPLEWSKTDLWRQVSQIPGVTISTISDEELERFGDVTSGQTLLYDATGNLKFTGGITAGRGHEGDNDGRTAIENYLRSGEIKLPQTPVFGCALTASEKKF